MAKKSESKIVYFGESPRKSQVFSAHRREEKADEFAWEILLEKPQFGFG